MAFSAFGRVRGGRRLSYISARRGHAM